MSLPIELSVRPDGRVGLEPVSELRQLRGEHWHFHNLTLGGGSVQWPERISGGAFEVEAIFRLTGPATFGFSLGSGSAGPGEALLMYDSERSIFTLERPQAAGAAVDMPLEPDEDGRIHLRMYLDGSVVEVFANGHACLAGREGRRVAGRPGMFALLPVGVDDLGGTKNTPHETRRPDRPQHT